MKAKRDVVMRFLFFNDAGQLGARGILIRLKSGRFRLELENRYVGSTCQMMLPYVKLREAVEREVRERFGESNKRILWSTHSHQLCEMDPGFGWPTRKEIGWQYAWEKAVEAGLPKDYFSKILKEKGLVAHLDEVKKWHAMENPPRFDTGEL